MNLYIEVKNGQAVNHPAFEENIRQAFGNIPSNWEPFVRVQQPVPTIYQVLDGDTPSYQKIDGIWKDVWPLRDMTPEEKLAKQQNVKDQFNNRPQASNWSSWNFNEQTCMFEPPIPRPDRVEGKIVMWCGAENNWKDAPPYPTDGKPHKFDFFAWQWIPA